MNIGMAPYLILSIFLFLSNCTLNRHTVKPYKRDCESSLKLQKDAADVCLTRKIELPPKKMFTDGCSAWPNWKINDCCVKHDIQYWCGGTIENRRAADNELRSCVSKETGPKYAWIVYRGVRLGGVPWFPVRWRWGYGYKYLKKHKYDEITPTEDNSTSP